jgi:transposase InsO family protein
LDDDEALLVSEDMSVGDKRKMLVKLHKQFGHATADRLERLLKSTGEKYVDTLGMLQDIVDSCEVCSKYKRPSPRPVVGLPLASTYNETVALDLHQLEKNVWYLHIIDEFSRFSAACVVKSKQSSEIVGKFIQCWIGVHGAPKKVYSDNGGEFNNAEFRDMAENFNIEVGTTPAFSPWCNGLLERHNQTLTDILLKVRADSDLDWETALAWAVNAKNSLHNVHGYSPYQIAFGQNPNLPSVFNSKPPALEGTTISSVVGKHISALHETRKAFTEAEGSEKFVVL